MNNKLKLFSLYLRALRCPVLVAAILPVLQPVPAMAQSLQNDTAAMVDTDKAQDPVSLGEAGLTTIAKPQWEFGLAAAGVRVPAYPASAVDNQRGFVLPWFIYRGETVRFQDGGLKVIALQNRIVTLDLSIGGSLNANSEDTPLRAGMPDLDYLLELGPKVDVRLWDHDLRDSISSRLNWSTALRLAFSTDFSSVRSRGPVLGTALRYRLSGLYGDTTALFASVGASWTGEKMMDYIYAVDPAYVTPQRAAYDAKAGYLGTSVSVGMGHRFNKKLRGYLGVAMVLHDGARNKDSPLFESNSNASIYGGISWTIKQSKATIRVLDAE